MVTLDPKETLSKVRFYLMYSCAILVAQLIGYTTFYGVTSASVLWPCAGVFGASLVISHRKHWIPMTLIMIAIDQTMIRLERAKFS